MSWVESASETFTARHDATEEAEAARVLAQLEHARARLERLFGVSLGELAVVLHPSATQLHMAQPWLAAQRMATAPAGRRYLVGWAAERELHVLSPRVLAHRASNVPGSLELLMLAPAALFARRLVAAAHPGMPPPFGPRSFRRWLRSAWLVEGAAQHFSGQSAHARPAVARRLREGGPPSFPPGARDAPVLAGTLFDLLAREEGERACVALALDAHRDGADAALERAFHGRPLRHTEQAWRAHLTRVAGSAEHGDADRRGEGDQERDDQHDGERLDPRRRRRRS